MLLDVNGLCSCTPDFKRRDKRDIHGLETDRLTLQNSNSNSLAFIVENQKWLQSE